MYRGLQKKVEINILMDQGGCGDAVAALPAIKYIHQTHPHIWINFWIPDFFFDFARLSLPTDKRLRLRTYAERNSYDQNLLSRGLAIHAHTNLATHLTDHAFNVIVNKEVAPKDKNYLPVRLNSISVERFGLPKDYVVVTTGFTSPVREFLPIHVNKVINYIKSKGYLVVFLGKEQTFNGAGHAIQGTFRDSIQFDQGINLINQTSLLESAKVIQGSKAIVGLDNGLLHVAAASGDVPIVGGFTTVEPKYRMPYRHDQLGFNYYPVVPPESLACRFCQSNWVFTYFGSDGVSPHSFTDCFYKDFACTKQLTGDLYIEQLEKIL